MKIIASLPVKNDAWCVGNAIEHLIHWCDHVFVFDASTEESEREVFKKYSANSKVTIISPRPNFSYTGPDFRNYQLDTVRSFDGNNLIFELHADEILSAKILDSAVRDELMNSVRPGSAIMMPWLTLWGDPQRYRADKSIWSRTRCWFAYVDDRTVKFQGPGFHGTRVPEPFCSNRIDFDTLCVLHYQFCNLNNERSKQALYHLYENKHYPDRNIEHINKKYAIAFDERGLKTKEVPEELYMPWVQRGVGLLNNFSSSGLNWRDIEVLRYFENRGIQTVRNLNIWYVDWEERRLLAIQQGISGIPDQPILDPRDFSTKLAHLWLMRTQTYPFWKYDFIRLIFGKLYDKLRNAVGLNIKI